MSRHVRSNLPGEQCTPPSLEPKAIMVDVDGTVALHKDVRGPYDTSRYHLDRPNAPVIAVVHALHAAGHAVVYYSGRSEAHRSVTEQWLAEHVGIDGDLHMRRDGDYRSDDIIKLELFNEHIRDHYDVVVVLDDRDRVVAAWRSIGLTVLQVAPGAF